MNNKTTIMKTSSTNKTTTTTTATATATSIRFQSLVRFLSDFVADLMGLLYRLMIHVIGNFLADIMEHPRVQHAAAQTMSKGMNVHMDDPELPRRAARIYIQLQEDADMSRQLGEQFPKVAASFIAGAASSLKRSASFSKLKRNHQNNNDSSSLESPCESSGVVVGLRTSRLVQAPNNNSNSNNNNDNNHDNNNNNNNNNNDVLTKLSASFSKLTRRPQSPTTTAANVEDSPAHTATTSSSSSEETCDTNVGLQTPKPVGAAAETSINNNNNNNHIFREDVFEKLSFPWSGHFGRMDNTATTTTTTTSEQPALEQS
jgi:hypothetical protein